MRDKTDRRDEDETTSKETPSRLYFPAPKRMEEQLSDFGYHTWIASKPDGFGGRLWNFETVRAWLEEQFGLEIWVSVVLSPFSRFTVVVHKKGYMKHVGTYWREDDAMYAGIKECLNMLRAVP